MSNSNQTDLDSALWAAARSLYAANRHRIGHGIQCVGVGDDELHVTGSSWALGTVPDVWEGVGVVKTEWPVEPE